MYTPEFTYSQGVTFRRLAWSLNLPMTKVMKEIVKFLPAIYPSSEVCPKCKDNTKCEDCGFNPKKVAEAAALTS